MMIETEHLILRNWQESDALALYQMCRDKTLRRSGVAYFESIQDAEEAIGFWAKDSHFKAIIHRENGKLIGFISLGDMNRYEGYVELEYAIAVEYRNRGYATEAVKCMVDYGFSEMELSVIAAWVRSHNHESVRVLEKCAFTFEGRLRKHARDRSDTLCYSMLREEWEDKHMTEPNSAFAFSDAFDTIHGTDGLHLEIIEKNPGDDVILPFYWYDIYVGGYPVGKISIRIGDNYHSYYNGHVGYEVDPEYRGHRYSLEALKLVLPVAKHHGMERIYLTCDQSNDASRRIIELSGARLLEIAKVPREYFAWREGIEDHCIYQLDIR